MKLLTFNRPAQPLINMPKRPAININMDHVVSWGFSVSETNRLNFDYTTIGGNTKTVNILKHNSFNEAINQSELLTTRIIRFLTSDCKDLVLEETT